MYEKPAKGIATTGLFGLFDQHSQGIPGVPFAAQLIAKSSKVLSSVVVDFANHVATV
jgi:hypothetical protein